MINMEEIWKDIEGYKNKYQISNLGRVKSLPRRGTCKKEKILKLQNDKDNYHRVSLLNNNKKKFVLVHRLVAQAFIPNPYNYPCINHKDENKLNNKVDNLEWCTVAYNNKYGKRLDKIRKKAQKICQFDKNGNYIKLWENVVSINKNLGIKKSSVYECCSNKEKHKTAGGYIWKYFKEVI